MDNLFWFKDSEKSHARSAPAAGMSWLEYTVMNNSGGVMLVLSKYGYIGWMAPQDLRELHEASLDLIDKYGDRAVEDLLRVHPEYDIIRSLPAGNNFSNFFSATGDQGIIPENIFDKIDRRIIIGAGIFLLAYVLLD